MKDKRGLPLIIPGLLLIATALFLTCCNIHDEIQAARSVEQTAAQLEAVLPESKADPGNAGTDGTDETATGSGEVQIPDYILTPEMEMPVRSIDGRDYLGILQIPSLDMELPVLSQWSYAGLKIAPCRYSGSAYSGGLVIAAHNYRSHFGSLKALQTGDLVTFTDVEGNLFLYQVSMTETLMPTDVEEMKDGGWDLTLFTCTVGGSYRVTVRCELTTCLPAQ